MRRPRIAHVLNTIGLGGVPEAALHLIRALPPERYDCRVYVMKRSDDEEEGRGERLARFEEAGVPVCFPRSAGEKLAVASDLCGWLVAEGIDLLHTHSYKPNLYARLAGLPCREGGLRIAAHYHNQYDNKWEKDGSLTLERMLARSSDALLAVSGSVRDHVAERLGIARERVDVILNGVDAERFAGQDPARARDGFGLPPDRPVVGIVGRISPQKGQEDFLRAARLLAPRFPDALFLVVGSADDERLLARTRGLAGELGLGDAVRFTGHVTDMPALYAALDVLVAPSRWEGFGLMLVEAMAAGKPIVASAVGAIPEVLGEGGAGVLVAPADPAAIAGAVAPLLADAGRRAAMGAAGRLRARDFSWEASGRRLAAVYDRVLGR
ncbi:MAG TPA: glycosyltransferase [Burkholderiales bacterium]|nr:glycosyltransferase [Burkholderiales bacterium]